MRELRYFTVMEYEEEQQYLEQRHRQGWEFVNVSSIGIYQFKKCEPKEMIYQLDYNKEGEKNKEEYIQMFKDCGWEYITNFVGYSYFRKQTDDRADESIFCDNDSRLDMIKRIFFGKIIAMLAIFAGIIVPCMYLLSISKLKSAYIIIVFYIIFAIIYIMNFIKFGMKYKEYTRKLC